MDLPVILPSAGTDPDSGAMFAYVGDTACSLSRWEGEWLAYPLNATGQHRYVREWFAANR